MSTSFTQVFGGTTIYPSDVSYLALTLDTDIALEWPLEATTGNNVVARIIDVTPTGPFTIAMPDAMSVGVGQTVLFNNLGPDTITVDNAAGNAILSIGAGEQWQCYLIDNTTVGGVWRTFRYGAAVAQAQAAALAGAGLVAEGSELAQNYEVVDFSITPYSLTAPDRAKVFVWNGGLGTLNLPTAVAAGDGWFVQVRNGGQGDLTIDPSGSELINAASTLTLQPGDSAVIVSDGVQWYTIGLGQQAVFAFDYTTIAVTGGTYTLAGSELNRIAYRFNGTLTSNVTVVVPATVQQYWVNNATTGAFTLGLQASGSATTTLVAQGETAILYCDGTDIISATTSSPFAGILPVLQGGTGASNAASARTNLGATGIGSALFTAATSASARSTISAAASGANSDITSLAGLTTALTVGQGGTGGTTQSTARAGIAAAASGSNADITALTNAAGIQIGAPSLGAQGAGTINATGLFINGVGVGTGSGSVTSVAATVPSFLSVSGSPITTSGTLAISLSGTALPVANGGTGETTYTNGQLLIGNTTGNTLTKATLTAGSGISITNGTGSITIASTAGGGTVTSVAASGGTTGLTFTGSPITTSGTLTISGTLAIANGGTNATSASGARLTLGAAGSGANSDITSLTGLTTALTAAQGGTGFSSYAVGDLIFASTATAFSKLADVATGNALISGGVGVAPFYGKIGLTTHVTGTLEVGNGGTGAVTLITRGVLIGNGTNAVSATAAGVTGQVFVGNSGADPSWTALSGISVTSFSGGSTGLTPATATTGAITLAGTLAVANGGTGAATLAANNVLLGNGTGAVQVVAPSTTGNVLTSNGTTWTSSTPLMQLISTSSPSAATEVVFTGLTSAYSYYEIVFETTAGYISRCELSANNGSTWLVANYYSNDTIFGTSTVTQFATSGAGSTYIDLGGTSYGGVIRFLYPTSTANVGSTIMSQTVGLTTESYRASGRHTSGGNNAIRLYPAAGTVTGTFKLYGVKV